MLYSKQNALRVFFRRCFSLVYFLAVEYEARELISTEKTRDILARNKRETVPRPCPQSQQCYEVASGDLVGRNHGATMRDNSTDALAVAAATAVRRFVCVLRRALGKTTKRATPKIITKPMTLFSSGLSYCYWLLLPAFSFVFTWDSRLLLCCFVSVFSLFAYKPSRL